VYNRSHYRNVYCNTPRRHISFLKLIVIHDTGIERRNVKYNIYVFLNMILFASLLTSRSNSHRQQVRRKAKDTHTHTSVISRHTNTHITL